MQHGVLLGRYVRQRRNELRLTGEQVAARMGDDVPGNYVVQLENGGRKRMVGQPRLGQLARALDVSEVTLLQAAGMLTDMEAAPRPPLSDIDKILGELSSPSRQNVLWFARTLRNAERAEQVASAPAPTTASEAM